MGFLEVADMGPSYLSSLLTSDCVKLVSGGKPSAAVTKVLDICSGACWQMDCARLRGGDFLITLTVCRDSAGVLNPPNA